LAAAAAAMAAGASLEDVRSGLAASSNVPGRLRAFRSTQGAMIFDDSYNANPDSVAAAIAFLEDLDDEPWLVLGDMGELGPDAAALHRGMGELARDAGIRGLLCVGELSRETAAGFGTGAQWFNSVDELEVALATQLKAGRNVLIKGSRFMGLDQVVKHLQPAQVGEEA
jgi:UDP-N-acetylmuramoyl-tripeptide--D-alanyl-D-alanine ligase